MQVLTMEDPLLVVIDMFTGGPDTLERVERLKPDVVVIDLPTPCTLRLVQQIGSRSVDSQILVVGVGGSGEEILSLAEAGVTGFLPREARLEELIACVHRAICGEILSSPRMIVALAKRVVELAASTPQDASPVSLSGREKQILRLIDQGLSNKEIAARLVIELPTVKNHVHHILEKLAVHRRGEAAAKVRGNGPLLQLLRSTRRAADGSVDSQDEHE